MAPASNLLRLENALAVAVLGMMSLLPLAEIVGREVFGRGVPGSIPIVQHLTLWITFIGAALAARSDRLLALATAGALPQRLRPAARVLTSAAGAGIALSLALGGLEVTRLERETAGTVAWGIPVWIAVAIIPIGFTALAGRIVWHSSDRYWGRAIAALGLLIPYLFYNASTMRDSGLVWAAGLAIIVLTTLGLPIFATLGGAAMLMFWSDDIAIAAVPLETYRLSASNLLPAIPLFTLGGYILAEGGASRRLLRCFTALIGWMPGGLAFVITLLLAFFTPLTGASGVTIMSMGGLLLPLMVRAGYPEKTSIGLVTVSGSIGLLFPPSLPVILYGIQARIPIDQLFVAALLPGAFLVMVVAGYGVFKGWEAGAERTPFSAGKALQAIWEAKWELALPVIVLVGMFGGFATLVEASALTVLYAAIVECGIYRDLSVRRDIPRIIVECATLIGGFLIILGVALGFTNYMIDAEVPTHMLEWVQGHVSSPIVFLLALNLFLILVGALMDIYSAILVIVPLILPIGRAYGIDPVHLGIIFLANMELGYLMPPMGENLFLSSYRFHKPLTQIYVSTIPFIVILLAAVLLITYVPWITLYPLSLFNR